MAEKRLEAEGCRLEEELDPWTRAMPSPEEYSDWCLARIERMLELVAEWEAGGQPSPLICDALEFVGLPKDTPPGRLAVEYLLAVTVGSFVCRWCGTGIDFRLVFT